MRNHSYGSGGPMCPALAESVEFTPAVVIGSGLAGLAIATELQRKGVDAIVLGGMDCGGAGCNPHSGDFRSAAERTELLRLLRSYARSHQLDVRPRSLVQSLNQSTAEDHDLPVRHNGKWVIQTSSGTVLADTVVLTRVAQNHFRSFLRSLGIAVTSNLKAVLQTLGIYLVGVGESISPTTREIVRQAKGACNAITFPKSATIPLTA
ncbi:FAD-binding protein [Arthrobacter roseus]|uniref:FAD-binding protein n=1 Tax=Arthrobacter roseus TaxID=136274 RepID=UPI0019648C08|nr:FAD-binding protein [Arthrobacter roseus]MBM7847356.1 hypothetical protein [Arthrobacter roseus]